MWVPRKPFRQLWWSNTSPFFLFFVMHMFNCYHCVSIIISLSSDQTWIGHSKVGKCSAEPHIMLPVWYSVAHFIFPEMVTVLCCAYLLSHIWLSATPWTVARQAPLSMGFSRPEYWSGMSCPPSGDLPSPGIEPRPPTLQADSLLSEPWVKPQNSNYIC